MFRSELRSRCAGAAAEPDRASFGRRAGLCTDHESTFDPASRAPHPSVTAGADLSAGLDASWTIAAAFFVFFMHAGFGFFEAGMCREKNTVDTLSHNLIILSITFVVFWAVGFGLMFGNGNGLAGLSGFLPMLDAGDSALFGSLAEKTVPLVIAFAFAMSFADTPATLIAGTGAERIRFGAVVVLTVVISGLIMPVVGHWTIGGGWLTGLDRPVYDTGSGMIHLTGGACALAVAIMLGPRRERFERNGKGKREDAAENSGAKGSDDDQDDAENEDGDETTDEHGGEEEAAPEVSSMPMVFLGAFILWLGFFAFNAGFAMHVSASIGLVFANTALAGATGAVATMTGTTLLTGKAGLRVTIVGLLSANVAITSCAGIVAPWAAVAIGALAAVATLGGVRLVALLRIDDPTEYLTMNLVGGLLGLVVVALFASPAVMAAFGGEHLPGPGLVYGGGDQFGTQLLAAAAMAGFALPVTALVCLALRGAGLLRVDPREEAAGSDEATHGERAYEGGGKKGSGRG